MALDITDPNNAPNFRDVGQWVNLIAGRELFAERLLLRSGTIKYIAGPQIIDHPKTIVCLKNSADAESWAAYFHFPRPDTGECYQTGSRAVRSWLYEIIRALAARPAATPILVHCYAGRDRTGVVIATILTLLEVPRDVIIEEFLLSDGADRKTIVDALNDLAGFRDRLSADTIAELQTLLSCNA